MFGPNKVWAIYVRQAVIPSFIDNLV